MGWVRVRRWREIETNGGKERERKLERERERERERKESQSEREREGENERASEKKRERGREVDDIPVDSVPAPLFNDDLTTTDLHDGIFISKLDV
eukprot:1150294-Amorphochlora_amoeboformis.AAC.1